jgi:hypothetical protein
MAPVVRRAEAEIERLCPRALGAVGPARAEGRGEDDAS